MESDERTSCRRDPRVAEYLFDTIGSRLVDGGTFPDMPPTIATAGIILTALSKRKPEATCLPRLAMCRTW